MKYTCEHCKGNFESIRPERDAIKEYEENFNPDDEKMRVCDDCYHMLMDFLFQIKSDPIESAKFDEAHRKYKEGK